MEREGISFFEEEMVQLSIKSSKVEAQEKLALICSVWTTRLFNPNNLRAHLKSLWKTKHKFEIRLVGPNLFLISFDSKDDLELIMDGRPWSFRRQLVVFDHLTGSVERSKIRLVVSPFWLKVGPCPLECDRKYLMHAIKSTFRGLNSSKIVGYFSVYG